MPDNEIKILKPRKDGKPRKPGSGRPKGSFGKNNQRHLVDALNQPQNSNKILFTPEKNNIATPTPAPAAPNGTTIAAEGNKIDVKIVNLQDVLRKKTEYKAPAAATPAPGDAAGPVYNDGLQDADIEAHRKPAPDSEETLSELDQLKAKSRTSPEQQAEILLQTVNVFKTMYEKKLYRDKVLAPEAFKLGKQLSRDLKTKTRKEESLTENEQAIIALYKEYLFEVDGMEWGADEIDAMKVSLAQGIAESGHDLPWWATFMMALGAAEQSRVRLIMNAGT